MSTLDKHIANDRVIASLPIADWASRYGLTEAEARAYRPSPWSVTTRPYVESDATRAEREADERAHRTDSARPASGDGHRDRVWFAMRSVYQRFDVESDFGRFYGPDWCAAEVEYQRLMA